MPHTHEHAASGAVNRSMASTYPELADARIQHEEHVLAEDCPLFASGGFPNRPTVTTPDPALALADDLVRADLPVALMERAATTGFAAANALLARCGVYDHELWSVTNGGWSPSCAQSGAPSRVLTWPVRRAGGCLGCPGARGSSAR